MSSSDISQQGKKIVDQMTTAVENAGKDMATTLSNVTGSASAEATEETIQAAVDKALDVLKIASEQVIAKDVNGERVTLQVGVGIPNIAQFTITTDVPGKGRAGEISAELS